MSFKPDASRYTDAELDSMGNSKMRPVDTAAARRRREQFQRQGGGGLRSMMTTLTSLAISEGAIAMLSTNVRNHDGTIFVQQAGPYKVTDPENFLDVAIGYEDYIGRYKRL